MNNQNEELVKLQELEKQIVKLDNGHEMPMLLWTPKGRDFILDLCEKEMPVWYA